MGSNTNIVVVEIHILIGEDPMNINRIIRKSLPVKGFRLGKATLIFDKLIHIPIYRRRGSRPIYPVYKRRGAIYDTRKSRTRRHTAGWNRSEKSLGRCAIRLNIFSTISDCRSTPTLLRVWATKPEWSCEDYTVSGRLKPASWRWWTGLVNLKSPILNPQILQRNLKIKAGTIISILHVGYCPISNYPLYCYSVVKVSVFMLYDLFYEWRKKCGSIFYFSHLYYLPF